MNHTSESGAAIVDHSAAPMQSLYGEYLPTPREIAEACAAIRAGWSAKEHRQRCVGERQVLREHHLQMPRTRRLELA